tara:strand:- start:234 stop:842 length:609 start_codon:yes stop_codon:yes gene_type:complete
MIRADSGGAGEIARIQDATKRLISVNLQQRDSLILALTCATMETQALLELSHDRIVCLEATKNAGALQLKCVAFRVLFCDASATRVRRDLAAINKATQALLLHDELPEAAELNDAIAQALRMTLQEPQQKTAWEKPNLRRLAMLALLRKDDGDSIECLQYVLGEIVGSDLRRWNDLREQLRDDGIDLILVSETISEVVNATL